MRILGSTPRHRATAPPLLPPRPASPPLVGPGAVIACAQRAQSCQDLLCNELAASWLPTLPLQSRAEANQLLFFSPPPPPPTGVLLDGFALACSTEVRSRAPPQPTAPHQHVCCMQSTHARTNARTCARTHERTHARTHDRTDRHAQTGTHTRTHAPPTHGMHTQVASPPSPPPTPPPPPPPPPPPVSPPRTGGKWSI